MTRATRKPKVHHFHGRLPSTSPMKLSEPGASVTSATIRMFATYRGQGNAIVLIKYDSDPDDTDNSLLSICEPNRLMKFPLSDITFEHVPNQRHKGIIQWETLIQIFFPLLTTEGDQTTKHHTLAFNLLPADARTGLNISAVAASLNHVRITDIASRVAKLDSDSIGNKLKLFVAKTELSKHNPGGIAK